MKTLILASGEGTRLKPLTDTKNKGMLEVGGKPVLEHIVKHCARHGYKDIVMAVGVKKEQVMDYFGNGSNFGVNIQYSISDRSQGTAGEIALASKYLQNEENFLLYYGDTLTGINLNIFHEMHKHSEYALITTPVIKGIPAETSLVEFKNDGTVARFVEKPELPVYANIPIFIVNKKVLSNKNIAFGKDFSSDVVAQLVDTGCVFVYDETKKYDFIDYSKLKPDTKGLYHYDVGTLRRYEQICQVFEKGEVGIVRVIK